MSAPEFRMTAAPTSSGTPETGVIPRSPCSEFSWRPFPSHRIPDSGNGASSNPSTDVAWRPCTHLPPARQGSRFPAAVDAWIVRSWPGSVRGAAGIVWTPRSRKERRFCLDSGAGDVSHTHAHTRTARGGLGSLLDGRWKGIRFAVMVVPKYLVSRRGAWGLHQRCQGRWNCPGGW